MGIYYFLIEIDNDRIFRLRTKIQSIILEISDRLLYIE